VFETVDTLVKDLYSLKEPWRGRFIALVTHLATGNGSTGFLPGRDQVADWLWADPRLCREVKLLLDAWPRSGN